MRSNINLKHNSIHPEKYDNYEPNDILFEKYQQYITTLTNTITRGEYLQACINHDPYNQIHWDHLYAILQLIPQFQKENPLEKKLVKSFLRKSLDYMVIPACLAAAMVARVAQREFSVAVVSDKSLPDKTFFDQGIELGNGVINALKTGPNYTLAGLDSISSFAISILPLGLKHWLNSCNINKDDQKFASQNFIALKIIIQFIEKNLEAENYVELKKFEQDIESLCNNLKTVISYQEQETNNIYKNIITSPEEQAALIKQLNKTEITNQDYSSKQLLWNSLYNLSSLIGINTLNHVVITISSSYSAQTLTWDKFLESVLAPRNIISTTVRATIMKLVNEYLVKEPLIATIEGFSSLICQQKKFSVKNSMNNLAKYIESLKPATRMMLTTSIFGLTTFVSNGIKTIAADVTQNKGDWGLAMEQFNQTFWTWEMLLIAISIVISDSFNLKYKPRKVCSLLKEKKEQENIFTKTMNNYNKENFSHTVMDCSDVNDDLSSNDEKDCSAKIKVITADIHHVDTNTFNHLLDTPGCSSNSNEDSDSSTDLSQESHLETNNEATPKIKTFSNSNVADIKSHLNNYPQIEIVNDESLNEQSSHSQTFSNNSCVVNLEIENSLQVFAK